MRVSITYSTPSPHDPDVRQYRTHVVDMDTPYGLSGILPEEAQAALEARGFIPEGCRDLMVHTILNTDAELEGVQ